MINTKDKKHFTVVKLTFFLMVILLTYTFSDNQVKANTNKKYILYLSSYSYSWESVSLQIEGIQKAIGDSCIINYEFMDTKNASYNEDYREYYDILKFKLSQRAKYDGVIVADDAALNFIQKYKSELFPDTPIVFTGIDNIDNAEEASKDPNISGVEEKVDYKKNIKIAKKLLPEANKIVFINDRKENGIGIQKQLSEYSFEGYDVTYLISTDYTKSELQEKLRELDKDTIVFINSIGEGKGGITYTEDERLDLVSNNISVPVFKISSENYPDFYLGGYVVDHKQCAYLAGKMLCDTFNGKSMEEEKLVEDTPSVYCFNQKVMKKYNIPMSRLPKDTIIKNQDPTFVSKHYKIIIELFVILSFTMLCIIIYVTWINLRKSKRANRKIEEQKEELEKALQTKTDFLSRMSHEIRTPLNSILGCSHLAKISYKKNEDITEDLNMIDHAGAFLLNIINDILDVSRIEAKKIELNKEWCSPVTVLENIIFMMKPIMEEKKISFEYPEGFSEALKQVEWYVDPRRVQQIIVNLLNNASKFTPEGGTVCFKVESLSHDSKMATDRVTVSDTGCGMSNEFISHIGEAFTQEQNKYSDKVVGSGLGLYIVKKIIEMMGGNLEVESEIGKGSSFQFNISYEYRISENIQNQSKVINHELHIAGMKVLYAEDNEMNQEIGKLLLENQKVQVVIASDGEDVVKKFEESEEHEYDLILMDMRMPKMSGLEATAAIRNLNRKEGKSIPIIALSADAIPSEVAKAKSQGLNDYITKPINPEELYQTLQKWKKDL